MESEKVYPISEKKLLDLRDKGLVPHSKIAARMFTLGVLVLFTTFFKSRFRRILYMLTNTEKNNHLDYISVIITEATMTLIVLSVLLFFSYFIFSLLETKFLILPYGRHKEGARKLKNPIPIKTELVLGLFTGTLVLIWAIFSIRVSDDVGLLSLKLSLQNSLNIFGVFAICLAFTLSTINKLNFRLSHKMSKEEIIKESLEGEMSPSNRRLIDRASGDL